MVRTPRLFRVLGFDTTHDALDAEALLNDLGVDAIPVPAPKGIGALCGIVLRIELADEERAVGYLTGAGIRISARGEVQDV